MSAPGQPRDNKAAFLDLKITDPDAYGAMAEAMHGARREPGFLAVLGRHETLPPTEAIAEFARAADLDVYTARQKLLSPTPRVLRREETAAAAASFVGQLKAAGLNAFEISEEELAAHGFATQHAVYTDGTKMMFEGADGKRWSAPLSSICCIVAGEVKERLIRDRTSQSVLGEVSLDRENMLKRAEMLIDIHFTDSPVAARLGQDSFHFRTAFPDAEAGSSAVLIRRLLERTRRAVPAARVYNEFQRAADVLGTSTQMLSNSLFLQLNWTRPGWTIQTRKETQSIHSESAAFDIYSALSRLEVIRG